jgi:hypothetical protein
MTEDPELVCVQRCYGMDVAEIFKTKLEAMEIPVLLEYDSAGKLFGLTIDGLGEVRVMVPKRFAAEAEVLLSDAGDGVNEEVGGDSEGPQMNGGF